MRQWGRTRKGEFFNFFIIYLFFVPVQMIASLGHNRNVKPSAD